MKGRLIDFSFGYNRKQRITIELDSDFREGFDALKDSELTISIAKYHPKRSKDSNAYFHVLVNEIAMSRGLSDDEVKRKLVMDYGVVDRDKNGKLITATLPVSADIDKYWPYAKLYKEIELNGRPYNCWLFYKRSSDMNTKEMSRLIDGAIYEAKELGIDTDTPEVKARYS